ncbi:MAG: MFS transporter [Acidobacteria bacterium]|nr:MFS transporter [Acidobacteriota bacterium]
MHGTNPTPKADPGYRWYKDLDRYHWLVLTVASLGWLFDTMDQQLFNLARRPAITELLGARPGDPAMAGKIAEYAGYSTMIFMIGWAIGGVIFGILGDRIGRARTMILTILSYSLFTGLSVLSTSVWDFSVYRFLTGLGVGGQFAVGVALVAETVPARARPYALGTVQACSAIGNMLAALIGIGLGSLEQSGAIGSAWRMMFVVGALPALLALVVFRKLKEPEQWRKAKESKQLGSMGELFSTPRWRHNALTGMLLAFAGVVGLWGIGFFSFDLISSVLDKSFRAQGLPESVIAGKKTMWTGITSLVQNLGAFFGVYAFTYLTARMGRKPAFALTFVAAMISTAFTFWFLDDFAGIFWMIPIMGFCQIALFGGYAIYFPELFPTRLRSTGTSFCYNVGRLVAALGPLSLGLLTSRVYAGYPEPMRYAGVTMCLVFLVGLAALPFAPETRGEPLPE